MVEESEELRLLGLTSVDFSRLEYLEISAAQAQLQSLQQKARRTFRQLALKLHPDQNGGDECKTNLFRALAELVSRIEAFELQEMTTDAGISFDIPNWAMESDSEEWASPRRPRTATHIRRVIIIESAFVVIVVEQ